jgi:16S rRNA (guanine966-N2)-methyltransferase
LFAPLTLSEIHSNNLLKRNGIIAIERETKKAQFAWPQPFIEEKVRSYGQGSIFYGGYSASVLP